MEDLKSMLHCPACSKVIVDPTLLPCHHSTCRSCIRPSSTGSVRCPECHVESHCNASSLPKDSIRDALLKVIEAKSASDSAAPLVCCDCDSPSAGFCTNCEENFCERHVAMHKSAKRTSSHVITEPKGAESSSPKCPVHPARDLVGYCMSDRVYVCRDCSFENHRQHDVQLITALAAKARQDAKTIHLAKATKIRQSAEVKSKRMVETIGRLESELVGRISEVEMVFEKQSQKLPQLKEDAVRKMDESMSCSQQQMSSDLIACSAKDISDFEITLSALSLANPEKLAAIQDQLVKHVAMLEQNIATVKAGKVVATEAPIPTKLSRGSNCGVAATDKAAGIHFDDFKFVEELLAKDPLSRVRLSKVSVWATGSAVNGIQCCYTVTAPCGKEEGVWAPEHRVKDGTRHEFALGPNECLTQVFGSNDTERITFLALATNEGKVGKFGTDVDRAPIQPWNEQLEHGKCIVGFAGSLSAAAGLISVSPIFGDASMPFKCQPVKCKVATDAMLASFKVAERRVLEVESAKPLPPPPLDIKLQTTEAFGPKKYLDSVDSKSVEDLLKRKPVGIRVSRLLLATHKEDSTCIGYQNVFELTWADGKTTEEYGPNRIGSAWNRRTATHTLAKDEYITGISVGSASYNIKAVKIHTNKGEYSMGGYSSDLKTFKLPEAHIGLGLIGSVGTWVDSIGLMYAQMPASAVKSDGPKDPKAVTHCGILQFNMTAFKRMDSVIVNASSIPGASFLQIVGNDWETGHVTPIGSLMPITTPRKQLASIFREALATSRANNASGMVSIAILCTAIAKPTEFSLSLCSLSVVATTDGWPVSPIPPPDNGVAKKFWDDADAVFKEERRRIEEAAAAREEEIRRSEYQDFLLTVPADQRWAYRD